MTRRFAKSSVEQLIEHRSCFPEAQKTTKVDFLPNEVLALVFRRKKIVNRRIKKSCDEKIRTHLLS